MEENEENESLPLNALKAGLTIGLINIVITVLLYVVDSALFAKWWVGILILVLNLVLVIVFGIKYRNSIGGFIPFGKAFLHGYITLIAGALLGLIFNILLYNVIDPDLPGVITDASIEATGSMMQSMGAPSDSIDETLAELETTMPQRFSTIGLVKQYGWTLLISAVVALITGLIVKKNEPIGEM